MTPKADRQALIAVRAMQEQEWCFRTRVLGHRSVLETSRLSLEPAPVGLGYYLSPHMVKGMLRVYAERMAETLQEDVAERAAQEAADLDQQYRAAAQLANPIDELATQRARRLGEIDDEDVVQQDPRVVLAALATMRQIGERRAKLLGLDAETKTTVTVEHVTATDKAVQELAAELDRSAR